MHGRALPLCFPLCGSGWTRRVAARLGRRVAVLVLCAWVAVPSARADEPEPVQPLTRLSAGERAALERRIPGLTGLPRERQDLIVRNVERLRGLDPEQRRLVERRFKAAREAGLGGQDLAERGHAWLHMPGGQQTLAEWQGKAMKALAWRAWRELPAELREHPAMAPLLYRQWPAVFHQRYLSRAVAALDVETAKAWQPPLTLPQTFRDRFFKERTKLLESLNSPGLNSTGPASARALQQLKRLVLQGRALEVVREAFSVPVTGPDTPALRLALLGERLGALTGQAFAETVAEFSAQAARVGPEAFAAQVKKLPEPVKLPPELQRKLEAYQVVLALEAWRSRIAAHPALVPQADALLRAALVDDLGMAPTTFDQLPARDAPGEARVTALRAWADETLPRELRKLAFTPRGGPDRGPGGRGERGPWGGHRPEKDK